MRQVGRGSCDARSRTVDDGSTEELGSVLDTPSQLVYRSLNSLPV